MRTLRLLPVVLVLLAALLLAGCGGDDENKSTGSTAAGVGALADSFPKDTLFFAEAIVRPDGDLEENAKSVLGKLLGKSPDQVGPELVRQLDEDSGPGEMTWNDVKQFLGKRAAVGVLSLDGSVSGASAEDVEATAGVVVEVTDPAKAEDALAKEGKRKTSGSQAYYRSPDGDLFAAVVGDRIIAGSTEPAFKQMLAVKDAPGQLDDADSFKKARDEVQGDQLLFLYGDVGAALDRAEKLATDATDKAGIATLRKQLGSDDPVVSGTATFTGKAITVDIAGPAGRNAGAGGNEAMLGVPGDAWLALGVSDFGKVLSDALDQIKDLGTIEGTDIPAEIAKVEQGLGIDLEEDLFSWMGDMAIFVRGTSESDVNGALVVKSLDDAKSTRAIDLVKRTLGQAGSPAKETEIAGAKGIEVDAGGMKVLILQRDGKLTIALGEQAARDGLDPKQTLEDNASLKAASEELDGVDPVLFVGFSTIAEIAKKEGDLDPQEARALDALDALVAGTRSDGDTQHVKAALVVR